MDNSQKAIEQLAYYLSDNFSLFEEGDEEEVKLNCPKIFDGVCADLQDRLEEEVWKMSGNAMPTTRSSVMEDRHIADLAEQIIDKLSKGYISNITEYREELASLRLEGWEQDELANLVEIELHNRWSFGFCDRCGEVIWYDDDNWYDLCCLEPEEQAVIEPKVAGTDIQDICSSCFADLLGRDE